MPNEILGTFFPLATSAATDSEWDAFPCGTPQQSLQVLRQALNELREPYAAAFDSLEQRIGEHARARKMLSRDLAELGLFATHFQIAFVNKISRPNLANAGVDRILAPFRIENVGNIHEPIHLIAVCRKLIEEEAAAVCAGLIPVTHPSRTELEAVLARVLESWQNAQLAERKETRARQLLQEMGRVMDHLQQRFSESMKAIVSGCDVHASAGEKAGACCLMEKLRAGATLEMVPRMCQAS